MTEPTRESEAMVDERTVRELVNEYGSVYLKGMAMGMADAVPGMSGGTIAFITGIYERLITAITALDPAIARRVPGLGSQAGRRRLWRDLLEMDVPFLAALGFGMVTSFLTVTRVAEIATRDVPGLTYSFFFGLIAASALILYSEIDLATPGRIAVAVFGFSLAFVVSGLSSDGLLASSPPTTFLAGTIAISAMVLPGISGSSLLLLLGQYEYLIGRLTEFVDAVIALASGGPLSAVTDPGVTVASFLGGAVIGLFSVAYLIKRALATYRVATLTFLVSLLAGTLRAPYLRVKEADLVWTTGTTLEIVLAAVVGALAVLALDYYTDDLEY